VCRSVWECMGVCNSVWECVGSAHECVEAWWECVGVHTSLVRLSSRLVVVCASA